MEGVKRCLPGSLAHSIITPNSTHPMLGKYITHCENSLTAAVITHLFHLPIEISWKILCNACYSENWPQFAGEPKNVCFWPNWNPEGTNNTLRVEPDVFIRFEEFDLIVEAKRWDHPMQTEEQWAKELTAYDNVYGDEKVPVRILALGGVWQSCDDQAVSERVFAPEMGKHLAPLRCPVHMCRWSRLLAECKAMEKELRKSRYRSSESRAHERILSDLVGLFAWHGFQTGEWFVDVISRLPRLSYASNNSCITLRAFGVKTDNELWFRDFNHKVNRLRQDCRFHRRIFESITNHFHKI